MSSDGGPAFPVPDERDEHGCGIREGSRGMSIRDYFAAAALQGMLAHSLNNLGVGGVRNWHDEIAEESFEIADAMLKAGGHGDG